MLIALLSVEMGLLQEWLGEGVEGGVEETGVSVCVCVGGGGRGALSARI